MGLRAAGSAILAVLSNIYTAESQAGRSIGCVIAARKTSNESDQKYICRQRSSSLRLCLPLSKRYI